MGGWVGVRACVRVCMCACVRACVCVCVCDEINVSLCKRSELLRNGAP